MKPRAIRTLIVGIPNVGKSTLINRMTGRSIAATGDRPGVTKAQQWIKLGKELELLDTPGILWPKFEDEQVGLRLAATGAIKETIYHSEDVAFDLLKYLLKYYIEALHERYGLDCNEADAEDRDRIIECMEEIGRKRGCLQGGGIVNLEKASNLILRDLQTGKLGRISLEKP